MKQMKDYLKHIHQLNKPLPCVRFLEKLKICYKVRNLNKKSGSIWEIGNLCMTTRYEPLSELERAPAATLLTNVPRQT